MHILGMSGSLRRGSYNSALLRAATERVPEGSRIEIASIEGIPLYDGDLEAEQGIPVPVQKLKDSIAKAGALLLVTPEYNHSIPGVFKNAIDWISRPPDDIERVFGGRPVAVMGASPGRGGTRRAQEAWGPVLEALGMRRFAERQLAVARARSVFGEDGRLADETVQRELEEFLSAFVSFARDITSSPR